MSRILAQYKAAYTGWKPSWIILVVSEYPVQGSVVVVVVVVVVVAAEIVGGGCRYGGVEGLLCPPRSLLEVEMGTVD